jgi:hypothetical protein
MNPPQMLILDNVTVADLVRALEYTGLTVSNTPLANVFSVRQGPRQLPREVREFKRPALLKPQAG